MIAVVFSKDRALQLDATLNSIVSNCLDIERLRICVIYKTSSQLHKKQYDTLIEEHKEVRFVEENSFKGDLIRIVLGSLQGCVMFVTDDTIFTRNFSVKEIVDTLSDNETCIGFSLRLGGNTTYCYMQDKNQNIPEMEFINDRILKYNWVGKEGDFGYPLELSSSVYGIPAIMVLLTSKGYTNPNSLETAMYQSLAYYTKTSPDILCYKVSVAFSNPCNIVQDKKTNRHGNIDAEQLARDFSAGDRIDIDKYQNMTVNSVHQEEELYYKENK